MKKLTLLLASLTLAFTFASCHKEKTLKPQTTSATAVSSLETTTNNSSNNVAKTNLTVLAMSYYDGSCYPGVLNNGTQSKFIVQFNSYWSNSTGSTLNIFYRDVANGTSGLWSGGTLPQVFTYPQHFYTVPNTFVNGHTYEIQFSPFTLAQINTKNLNGTWANPPMSMNSWFITVTKCISNVGDPINNG